MTKRRREDSQALTGGDITDAQSTCGTDQISCSRQWHTVRWPTHQCVTRNVSRGSEDYLAGMPKASGNVEAYSDADWRGGDKATRRSVSAGAIMRGGQLCEGVDQTHQVLSLSTAESELKSAVKAASEGLGRTCGYKRHPSQEGSSQRKSART